MAPPLQPDDGTVGPDLAAEANGPSRVSTQSQPFAPTLRIGPAAGVAAGVLLAVLVGSVGTARAGWKHMTTLFAANGSLRQDAPTDPGPGLENGFAADDAAQNLSQNDVAQLDRLVPQTQAEALLERAVGESDGAVEQIMSRADGWRGKIQWSSQIASLTTAALASQDVQVRQSGVEVELAAYGLAKDTASLNYLMRAAASSNHEKKIWALWSLGLLANRGVGTSIALQALTAHLRDPDEDSRRWAVAALAQVGAPQTIVPLLHTMHDDASPSVRLGAASSLAESGMLTHEQRLGAVPQLLNYTDDPALDVQTRTWAFQALACITGKRLPNDSGAWRLWYTSTKVD